MVLRCFKIWPFIKVLKKNNVAPFYGEISVTARNFGGRKLPVAHVRR